MPKIEANPARPPRFPYVGALLCAGCVGMAGYLWMRYSYVWDVSPTDMKLLWAKSAGGKITRFDGMLVRITAKTPFATVPPGAPSVAEVVLIDHDDHSSVSLTAQVPRSRLGPEYRVFEGDPGFTMDREYPSITLVGRKGSYRYPKYRPGPTRLDCYASRFHPASVSGLVVGAMGLFVFTVALRHWLRERKAATEPKVS